MCIEKRPYTLYGRLATLHFRYLTCLLDRGHIILDLFSYSVELFEKIGHDNIHRYTSIKKGINKGKWPDDFLKELAKPDTVSENTHFNKDGAMLITKGLVELILKSKNPQLCELQSALLHNVV